MTNHMDCARVCAQSSVSLSSIGLRDQGLDAGEKADGGEDNGVEDGIAERRGGDREGGMGHAADHDGVDDIGRHPAELSEGERRAEAGGEFDLARQGPGVVRADGCIAESEDVDQNMAPEDPVASLSDAVRLRSEQREASSEKEREPE